MFKHILVPLLLFGTFSELVDSHLAGSFGSSNRKHSVQPAVVTTPLGAIKGSTLKSILGKTIYAFRGVRFAKAPVNELRFQPPQPVEKWEGVYNATADGATCPQPIFFEGPVSEDCLFLNVYTTKLPKGHHNPKRSVLVFFHHGGFYAVGGASFFEGPEYLLDQDIVLVVPNYRLGVLGFLSTGTKEAPGNAAMKDQVLVLQWIKNNILAFGGDPNSVTISGYSAGGVSVMTHLVSPMSKGLFHRAILMSGSAFRIPNEQLTLAQRQARVVNCTGENIPEMIECLKTKPAEVLGNSLPDLAEFGFEPVGLWSPVVEPDFGQERFLTERPVDALVNGRFQKVPIVVGLTAEEFAGRAFYILENETLVRQLDEEFERVAPIAFLYERDTENSRRISRALRDFYFGDKITNASLVGLTTLFSDSIVGFDMNRAAKLFSAGSSLPVYYYCFNYTARYSYFYLPGTNNTVPYGAVHHDDLIYLYPSVFFPYFNVTDPEYEVVKKLTTMWTNFAKSGKPIPTPTNNLDNVNWEPFTENRQVYLRIGQKLTIGENLYQERYALWESLFPLSGV